MVCLNVDSIGSYLTEIDVWAHIQIGEHMLYIGGLFIYIAYLPITWCNLMKFTTDNLFHSNAKT